MTAQREFNLSRKILFGTGNAGKLREMREIARSLAIQIISPQDVMAEAKASNRDLTTPPEVEETESTYRGNALLKARAFYEWSGYPSLADDAGLEVQALGGEPGIYSARYAGEPSDAKLNREKLLWALEERGDRRAHFRSVLALLLSPQDLMWSEATLGGTLAAAPRGSAGFGYDPLFVPLGHTLTLAELKERPGPVRTHRQRAAYDLFERLAARLGEPSQKTAAHA